MLTDCFAKSYRITMQLIEQRISGRAKNRREILSPVPSIAGSALPIALIKNLPVKFEKKQAVENRPDFASWNMPEPESGVIRCREHDFW